MKEEWAAVEDFCGFEISSMGSVRKNGVLRKVQLLNTGYEQITFPGKNKRSIHRLVAIAFCDGRTLDRNCVNHKNGVRSDNRASNLEWVTYGENQSHRYKVLGGQGSMIGRFGALHPTSKAVVATNMKTGERLQFLSGMDAVRFGFSSSCISRCCRGLIKHHGGHYWSFA